MFAAEVLPRFQPKQAAKADAKTAELAPYIEAALARKTFMRPLSEDEIPVVRASVKAAQIAGT